MADITIIHKNDSPGRKAGTASPNLPAVKNDSKKLASEIGKTIKSAQKDLGKTIAADLEKTLKPILSQIARATRTPGAAGGTGGISEAELSRIIKTAVGKTAEDLTNAIIKSQKTGRGTTTGAGSLANSKQIQQLLNNLNSILGSKGITVPSDMGKTIGDKVADAVDKVMQKDLGKAAQELNKAAKTIEASAEKTAKAVEGISKIKSGDVAGGVKDLVPVLKDLKRAVTDIKSKREAAKADPEIKKAAKDISKAADSLEKTAKQTSNINKVKSQDLAQVFKDMKKEFTQLKKNMVEEIKKLRAEPKDNSKLIAAYEKERQSLVKAISSKEPQKIKEALGKQLPGLDPNTVDKLRNTIVDLEKTFDKAPQEFAKVFKEGLSGKLTGTIEQKLEGVEKRIAEGNKLTAELIKKSAAKPEQIIKVREVSAKQDVRDWQSQNQKLYNILKQPRTAGVFPETAIAPAKKVKLNIEGSPTTQAFEQAKKQVQDKMQSLANSLLDLQNHIVTTLDKEFDKAGRNWAIVRDKNDKNVTDFFNIVGGTNAKTAGKQYAFNIANINAIKKQLFAKGKPAREGQSSKQIVDALVGVLADESAKNFSTRRDLIEKIAEWFKSVTADQIKEDKNLKNVAGNLVKLKDTKLKGKELSDAIGNIIGSNIEEVEDIFKLTIGKMEAMRKLRESKLIRSVSLPAARLTKTGAATFETSTGSKRALQKFAEFRTGFEKIYENLAKNQALVMSKNFAEAIRNVGVTPRGTKLIKARELAKDMITDFGKLNAENFNELIKGIREATLLKGGTAGTPLRKEIESAISSVEVEPGGKVKDVNKAINDLVNATEAAGVSMYDVVKTMDSIKFLNVYDIMKKVLDGAESGLQPLVKLGQSPNFQKSIRDFESAINQVQGTLPLIEPGRPRRALQQESVVKVLSQISDVFRGQERFNPEEQKKYTVELNKRFNEMFQNEKKLQELYMKAGATRPAAFPADVRTVSTIGIPGAQAAEMKLYRPKLVASSERFLGQMEATVNTMFTDILEDLAPLGEFTQKGREGLAGITNAISADVKEINKTAGGQLALTGMGTNFPSLRSQRESQLISSGRIGKQGYGFNVITELKHVAGTMEDQVLVSGKLADAITSITKTLVRPAPGGRVKGGIQGAEKVEEISPKVLADNIQKVYGEIQKVLGVPEEYKGRADKAFIDEVKKALTIIRGEEVEVQQARLTEVFLNSFGRKFFSRYGSKGVAAFPTKGLAQPQFEELTKALANFQKATVKVLAPQERKAAGLGVAVLPRSAGEILADVFGEDIKSDLRRNLTESGNKFLLDLFKSKEGGLLIPEEAKQQRELFTKIATEFEKRMGVALQDNLKGLEQIKRIAKEKGIATKEERAIDLRISSTGIGKRGLQPEVLEAVINNLAGVKGAGYTTIPTKLPQKQYEKLLGTRGPGGKIKPGQLSEISKAFGFSTQDKTIISKLADEKDRAIEEANAYYTEVLDQFGKSRKGIVGEKFFSIVEEPGQTEGWSTSDIRRGLKGISVDIPVFSAYSTVFGEQSKLIKEILGKTEANQKKQFEFLKALRAQADETGTVQERMSQYLEKVPVENIKYFDEATGVMAGLAEDLNPRNLKGTIFDLEKYAKPFLAQIPKVGGKAGETEPFYVPGALARGTYSESLIAGEKGIENIGRRLQHVINMAKKATELLQRPAAIRKQIEDIETELSKIQPGTPEAAALTTELISKKDLEQKILTGGEMKEAVKKRVTQTVTEFISKVVDIQNEGATEANQQTIQEIYNTLKNALSFKEAPAEAFRTKKGAGGGYLPPGQSEVENIGEFLNKQIENYKNKNLSEMDARFQAQIDAIRKASDILIGKGPQAAEEYNLVVDALAEIKQGMDQSTGAAIKEMIARLTKETRFAGKLGNIADIEKALTEKRRLIEPGIMATLNDINEPVTRLTKDLQAGKGIELATRLGINIDQELQFRYDKAMDKLQKAKIDYFHALAEAAVGKKGAIGAGIFRRKFPGVMKKATVAIVDRTEEMKKFISDINKLAQENADVLQKTDLARLTEAAQGIATITKEHEKTIGITRAQGLPILKQTELGIPEVTAKKLPAKFTKKFKIKGGEITATKAKETESTLYDMLTYMDKLEKALAAKDIDDQIKNQVKKHLREDLKPFVEAIRYPFTGVSSIVPFKSKLLTGAAGKAAEKTFVAPGIPDFDIGELNTYLDNVRKVIDSLVERREELQRAADETGMAANQGEISKLTDTIHSLRAAIEAVIPKYQAHTAKLDFDGDQIAVHTATTKEAREEIEKHFKTVNEFGKGLSDIQSRFRSTFTAEAALSNQISGGAILAEQQQKFLKKFPAGEGFQYLTRPFLTKNLEYAKPKEKLSILGIAEEEGMTKALENLIRDYITATVDEVDKATGQITKVPVAEKFIAAIKEVKSPFANIQEELKSIEDVDLEKRFSFAQDLLDAIDKADKELGSRFSEQIGKAVTSRVFEDKYKKAVEANLFKIETGIQTEALYRLSRLAEASVGFGPGIAGVGPKKFKISEQFKKRNPELQILGGSIEKIAADRLAQFNELFRFSLQKGMDVKHAGGKNVSGQIENAISRGTKGAIELWQDILDPKSSLGELKDFVESINEVIKERLGAIPTEAIRKELATLSEARGLGFGYTELAELDRPGLIEKVQEVVGFRGFLIELSNQVKEAAVKGIMKSVQNMSPEKRAGIGDIESYARGQVAKQISEGGINIREAVTVPQFPLYNIRQTRRLTQQAGLYKKKYGEITVPETIQFKREEEKNINELLDKYKEAKATAVNVQESLRDSLENVLPGSYYELVKATLENINDEQAEIQAEFEKLQTEGYKVTSPQRTEEYLKILRIKTLGSEQALPELIRTVLAKGPKEQRKEIERLSDLVGLPTMTEEELSYALGFGEEFALAPSFRKIAEQQVLVSSGGLSKEEFAKTVQEVASKLTEKAKVIYEMERIIDTLAVRAKEGLDLLDLFPKPGSVSHKYITGGKSYKFAEEMARVAQEGEAKRTALTEVIGPGAAGTGGIGGGTGTAGGGGAGGFAYTGGIVPVKIVDIAPGLTLVTGVVGAAKGTFETNPELKTQMARETRAAQLGQKFETHDPEVVIRELKKRADELDTIVKNWDEHQQKFFDPKFQEILKTHFPGFDFEEFNKRMLAGADPQKLVKEAFDKLRKKTFFATGLKYQGGSSLGAGGFKAKDVIGTEAERKSAQIEKIALHIMGLDDASIDRYQQAAYNIGTALHAKLQRKIEKSGANVDIEKFTYYEPKELMEDVEGAITGRIDLAYKNAENQIERISDIKTTGEAFAKFETIKKFIPTEEEGGIELEELLAQDIPDFLRQKLIEYSSQLNVYLAGLQQQAKKGKESIAPEGVTAEIAFIPSEDIELKTPARVVKFKFDPAKLKSDIDAIKKARTIVRDYLQHSERALEEAPKELQPIIQKLRNRLEGKEITIKSRRTPASYKFEEALDAALGKKNLDEAIDEYVRVSKKIFDFVEGKEGIYTETKTGIKPEQVAQRMAEQKDQIKQTAEAMAQMGEAAQDVREEFYKRARPAPGAGGKVAEEKIVGAAQGFIEPLIKTFTAMQEVHEASLIAQSQINKFEPITALEDLPKAIREALGGGGKPPLGREFSQLLSQLEKEGFIGFQDQLKAWKIWRVHMADFLIAAAKQAQQEFETAKSAGKPVTREFETFAAKVEKLREFMVRGFGKKTDIYTIDRQYAARQKDIERAGLYFTPQQLFEKSKAPFSEKDELPRRVFGELVDRLEAGVLGKPAEEIKKIVNELGNLDKAAQEVLANETLFERMGDNIDEALDFDKIADRARVLREALSQYSRLNFTEDLQTDIQKKFQVRGLLQYLKQIENAYGKIDFTRTQGAYEPGAVKVPSFVSPEQQIVLHRRNIQKYREFLKTPEEKGGPKIGEAFSYFARVVDEAGNVIKNVRVDFKKYGEAVDEAGNKIGRFTESQRDLVKTMQLSGGTFGSALRRVVMWGSAATLVYGGVQKLKESFNDLIEIETSIAQLRMVMNPLRTDFDMLAKSAVGFAKEYGVGVNEVLKSMKIFAQQGLNQAEVIDRTRASTLAANVTTLSASDATEAFTAAMKSFGGELGSANMALDAWSETEAKHAITAADMANAIKKSAAAAKTAGFTFNELNGIVAGIGAVTRQTGKEVGTAVRFISRRLFTEKGPQALAEVGIPTQLGTGENRKAFEILKDLAGVWDNLTNAQKLNIAQSLGGTRQYNALIVAMENWNEVLSAVEHSTNSKGSAERRNLEVMKTYSKQLQQTKAAATELQMELGKFVFPVFKGGLKALKTLLELINNIPTPVKAAGVALTLFFSYAAKGIGIFDSITGVIDKGINVFSNFFRTLKSQAGVGLFEIFGKSAKNIPLLGGLTEAIDTRGLKSLAGGVEEALRPKGTTLFDRLGEFKSGFGKLAYLFKSVGDGYNSMITGMLKGTENFGKAGAEAMDRFNDKVQGIGVSLAGLGVPLISQLGDIITIAGAGGEAVERLLFRNLEKIGGTGARLFGEAFARENSGLFKSLLPLATTLTLVAVSASKLNQAYKRATGTVDEYAQSLHNIRDAQSENLKDIRTAISNYDKLDNAIKKIQKDQKTYAKTPGLKEQRIEFKTYKDPLLELMRVQEQARDVAFDFLKSNTSAVQGVDKFGNVILNNTYNLKAYAEALEKAKLEQLALLDVDVAFKAIEDLTTEGSALFRELGDFLSEIPLLGKIDIGRSPLRVLNEARDRVNELLAIKGQFPLGTVMNKELEKAVEGLDKIRIKYRAGIKDLEKRISAIDTRGLGRQKIVDLFVNPKFLPGFKLIIDQKDLARQLKREIKPEEFAGTEILKRIFPQSAQYLDVDVSLIAGKIQEAGHQIKQSFEDIQTGDVVMFTKEAVQNLNASGRYAIYELTKTGDQVLNYFDTFSKQIKTLSLKDENTMNMVNAILPVHEIMREMEDRIEILSTFMTGAAAGIVGIEPKVFKKNFDLGQRFFSELPTTTLIQSQRGYAPGLGYTPESPFTRTNLFPEAGKRLNSLDKLIKEFYLDPLEKYNTYIKRFEKTDIPGASVELAKTEEAQIRQLQRELASNQVAVQYIALFTDLTKTMEASSRALQENIDLEATRLKYFKETSGLMKGYAEGLDAINLGIRDASQLTPRQRAVREVPGYENLLTQLKILTTAQEGTRESLLNIQRTRTQLGQLQAMYRAFDVTMDPNDMKQLAVSIAATGDKGLGLINNSTIKVKEAVEAQTNVLQTQTDKMLAAQGDPEAQVKILDKQIKYLEKTAPNYGPFGYGAAIENIGEIRKRAEKEGVTDIVKQADQAIKNLSEKLLTQGGGLKAIKPNIFRIGEPIEVAFQGGTFGRRDVKTLEIINKGFNVLKPELEKLADSKNIIGISKALNKLATVRKVAIENRDTEAVINLNKAMDVLAKALLDNTHNFDDVVKALNLAGANNVEAGEIYQRGLASNGKTMREVMDRLGKVVIDITPAGYGEGGQAMIEKILGVIPEKLEISAKNLPEFKDLKKSIEKGVNLQAEGLASTKNIIKGNAALVLIETFNKKSTNKQIKYFEEQLKQKKEEIKKRSEEGKPYQDLNKDVLAITKSLNKAQKELKLHELAATFGTVVGGSAALARALNVDEKLFSLVGGAGVTLYASMELMSKAMGEELPENFRNMRSAMADAAKEFGATGDVSAETRKKILAEGRTVASSAKDQFKKISGQSLESYQKGVEKQLEEARKEGRTISDKELSERAAQFARQAGAGEGADKFVELLLTALGSAASGYLFDKFKTSAENAKLTKALKDQNKDWENVLRNPKLEATVRELYQEKFAEAAKKGTDEAAQQFSKLYLSTEAVANELDQSLNFIFENELEYLKGIESGTNKIKDIAASIELAKEIEIQMRKMVYDIKSGFESLDVRSYFTGPGILNPNLRGFPGDVQLPVRNREMSTQQRLYSDLNVAGGNYNKKIQDSIRAYHAGFQANEKMVAQLEALRIKRRQLAEDQQYDERVIKDLDDTIKNLENTITNSNNSLKQFGEALRVFVKFREAMYKFGDALEDIRADEAIESLESFRKYKDNFDKLLGGSHPEAQRMVSVMEELQAARAGIRLGPTATQYDIQRAQLIQQARGAGGEQLADILTQLRLQPEQQARDIFAYVQQRENDQLRRQAGAFEQYARDLERAAQTEAISPEQASEFRKLRDYILDITGRAQEVIQGPEGAKYKGFGEGELSDIFRQQREVSGMLAATLPTDTALQMKEHVTSPIVMELERQTALLALMAEGREIPSAKEYLAELEKQKAERTYEFNKIPELFGPRKPEDLSEAVTKGEIETKSKNIFRRFWDYWVNAQKEAMKGPLRANVALTAPKSYGVEGSFAFGSKGPVRGPGGPKGDKIHAMLSDGEYVINTASAKDIGYGTLNYMNKHGRIPKMQEGGPVKQKGVFSTAFDWWDDAAKSIAKTRMSFVNDLTSGQIMTGESKGTKLGVVGSGINLTAQTGLAIAETGTRVLVQGLLGLFSGIESTIKTIDDSIEKHGLLKATAIAGLKLADFEIKAGIAAKNLGKNALTGELGGQIYDFVQSDSFKNIKDNMANSLENGIRTGTLFTGISAEALTAANLGSKVMKGLKYVKVGKEITEALNDTRKIFKGAKIAHLPEEIFPLAAKGRNVDFFDKMSEVRSIINGKATAKRELQLKAIKSLNEVAASTPNLADKIETTFIGELSKIKVRDLNAGGWYTGVEKRQLGFAYESGKGTAAHEILGHEFQDAVESAIFESAIQGKTPSKELLKYRNYMNKIGEMEPLSSYSAQYKDLGFIARTYGREAVKYYNPKDANATRLILKHISKNRFASENFAEFQRLGIKRKLPEELQKLFDTEFTPEKMNALIKPGKLMTRPPIDPIIEELNSPSFSKLPEKAMIKSAGESTGVNLEKDLLSRPLSELTPEERLAWVMKQEGMDSSMAEQMKKAYAKLQGDIADIEKPLEGFGERINRCGGGRIKKFNEGGKARPYEYSWPRMKENLSKNWWKLIFNSEGTVPNYLTNQAKIAYKGVIGTQKQKGTLPGGGVIAPAMELDPAMVDSRYLKSMIPFILNNEESLKRFKQREFNTGGKVRKFYADETGAYELDKNGMKKIKQTLGEFGASSELTSGEHYEATLKSYDELNQAYEDTMKVIKSSVADYLTPEQKREYNRPHVPTDYPRYRYRAGQGESGIGPGPAGPKARFGDVTAMETNQRYMKEFMAAHSERMEAAEPFKFRAQAVKQTIDREAYLPGKPMSKSLGGRKVLRNTMGEYDAAANKAAYEKDIFSLSDSDVRKKYGNVQADILVDYRKLKYALDNDPNMADKLSGKLSTLESIASKPKSEWTEADRDFIAELQREKYAAIAYTQVNAQREKEKYGFNPRLAFIADPKKFNDYVKLKELKGMTDPTVMALYRELSGNVNSQVVKTHKIATDPKLLKTYTDKYNALYNRQLSEEQMKNYLTGPELKQKEAEKLFGIGTESKQKFSGGGIVHKTGMIFAHGGEVILPKKYAEGGIAEQLFGPKTPNNMMSASLKEIKIDITGADELVNKIKDAIEKSTPQPVKIDTEGVSVPVDTEGVSIPVDAGNVADDISKAISDALSSVNIDTGAIGADKVDELMKMISDNKDQVFITKDEVESLRSDFDNQKATIITRENLSSAVQDTVRNAIDRVQKDIDKNTNDIAQVQSDYRRLDNKHDNQYAEVRRRSNEALDKVNSK